MGTRNSGFGYPRYHGEMGLSQAEQGFSSLYPKGGGTLVAKSNI